MTDRKRLAEQATPGPWLAVPINDGEQYAGDDFTREKSEDNAALIMACPPEVILAYEAIREAAQVVSDSPAGKRYGFLPLLNALAAFDRLEENGLRSGRAAAIDRAEAAERGREEEARRLMRCENERDEAERERDELARGLVEQGEETTRAWLRVGEAERERDELQTAWNCLHAENARLREAIERHLDLNYGHDPAGHEELAEAVDAGGLCRRSAASGSRSSSQAQPASVSEALERKEP